MPTFTIGYGKFRVQDWLFSLDISLEAKMTYIVLATCSGGSDHTWVTQSYLAERLKVSIRTVQRYLKILETAGLISRTWERLKGATRRVYHFLYNNIMETHNKEGSKQVIIHDNQEKPPEKPPSCLSGENENYLFTNQSGEAQDNADFEYSTEALNTPHWNDAKKILAQELPRFSPIFDLLTSRITDLGLIIEGPNVIVMRSIEQNHGEAIANALGRVGCQTFSYGVQPIEIQQILEKQFQEKELNAIRQAEETRKKVSDERAMEMERLENLPLKKQFEALANEYPLKKSRWMAWKVFMTLANRHELPSISILLKSIRNHKTSDSSWNKDNGRWIPSLPKWLRERRWIDQPSG